MPRKGMTISENLPKIAIYGLGAITITMAHALHQTKTPFTILCRNEKRKSDLTNDPIRFQLRSNKIEILPLSLRAKTLSEAKDPFDYIVIGTKSQNLSEAIASASPFLRPNGKLILIQNGFPETNAGISAKQMIGGVVGWNTQKLNNGIYFQSNIGSLILGGVDGEKPPLFFKTIFGSWIPVILTENLPGYRWHKLGINCVINGLSASCMLSLGKLMHNGYGRTAGIKILSEIRQAMEKSGVKEEVVPGSISIRKLGDGLGAFPMWLRHLILIGLGFKYYKIRTSMVQDLDQGRMTEIDDLNGLAVKIAKSLLLDAKVNEAVCLRVKDLEQKKIKPEISFLKTL